LAGSFGGREVVLLFGELGAGKTVFARGIAAGLGLEDPNRVCSPSYTLINIYPARVPVIHIDLYRLEGPEETEDLGWEDFLGQGVIVVEWAEKLPYQGEALLVHLSFGDGNRRKIRIRTRGNPGQGERSA